MWKSAKKEDAVALTAVWPNTSLTQTNCQEGAFAEVRQGCAQKRCSFHLGLFDVQIRDLDKGTFGFVQLAVDLTTGEQVAIKFIERSQEVRPPILRQIGNSVSLSHSNNCTVPCCEGNFIVSILFSVWAKSQEGPHGCLWGHQYSVTLTDCVYTGFEICGTRNPQS